MQKKRKQTYSRKIAQLMLFLSVMNAISNADAHEYIVQAGDSLSEVIARLVPGKLYGPQGTLDRVVRANPEVALHPDRIYPGQKITLDDIVKTAEIKTTPQVSIEFGADEDAPEKTPARVPASVITDDERTLLTVAPRFAFNRLDVTDLANGSKSVVGSDLSYGFKLGWTEHWSSTWKTEVSLIEDHLSERSTGKSIENSSFTHGQFDFSVAAAVTPSFQITSGMLVENAPFVRPAGNNVLVLDSVPIFGMKLGASEVLARTQLFGFEIGAEGTFRFPSAQETYQVQNGYDYKAFINLNQLQGKMPLQSQLFFQHVSQDTTLTTQSETRIGITLGLSFDLTP